MVFRLNEKSTPENLTAPPLPAGRNDPFAYFAGVINGDIKMSDNDLSALHNNETVIKILDAARLSAKKGKTVTWKELYH